MASVPQSRKTSVTSLEDSSIDQAHVLEGESRAGELKDFTGPVDEILALIQNVYDKKRKISSKEMQFVNLMIHEMINRIINCILPKLNDDRS